MHTSVAVNVDEFTPPLGSDVRAHVANCEHCAEASSFEVQSTAAEHTSAAEVEVSATKPAAHWHCAPAVTLLTHSALAMEEQSSPVGDPGVAAQDGRQLLPPP